MQLEAVSCACHTSAFLPRPYSVLLLAAGAVIGIAVGVYVFLLAAAHVAIGICVVLWKERHKGQLCKKWCMHNPISMYELWPLTFALY